MKLFTCEICSKLFNRKDSKKRHINEIHLGKQRDVKHHEKWNYINENKYGEKKSFLNWKLVKIIRVQRGI